MTSRLITETARLAGGSLLRLQSDERLVALTRAGHDQAFAAIVQRYRAPLVRYAGRLAGQDRAEDVLQQALLDAHVALARDDRPIDVKPWLYRIVHNRAISALRASSASEALPSDLAASGPSDVVELRDQLRRALDAVARLPQSQRDAVVLHALQGRSHEQVADALGITPGAARQQLSRARASLRGAVGSFVPFPLLARLLAAGGDGGAAGVLDAAGAIGMTGLGAAAVKLGAGVAATAAIAGGAWEAGLIERSPASTRPAAVERSVAARTSVSVARSPSAVPPSNRVVAQRPSERPPRARSPRPDRRPVDLGPRPSEPRPKRASHRPPPAPAGRPVAPAGRPPRQAPQPARRPQPAAPAPAPQQTPTPRPPRPRPTPAGTPQPAPTAQPTPRPAPPPPRPSPSPSPPGP